MSTTNMLHIQSHKKSLRPHKQVHVGQEKHSSFPALPTGCSPAHFSDRAYPGNLMENFNPPTPHTGAKPDTLLPDPKVQ